MDSSIFTKPISAIGRPRSARDLWRRFSDRLVRLSYEIENRFCEEEEEAYIYTDYRDELVRCCPSRRDKWSMKTK